MKFEAVILILEQSSCGKLSTLCIRSRDGYEYRFAIVTSRHSSNWIRKRVQNYDRNTHPI